MKRLLIAIFVFLAAVNCTNAQFNFITAFEGLEKAKETAISDGIADPVLVIVNWANFVIPMGPLTLVGELKTEGEDIGKATLWVYTFVDSNDITKISHVGVGNFMGAFAGHKLDYNMGPDFDYSYSNPIELTEKNDSPKMVSLLVQDPIYTEYFNSITIDPNRYSLTLSICSLNTPYQTIEANEKYWIFTTVDNENETSNLLCSIKYDILSLNIDGCSVVSDNPAIKCQTYNNSSIIEAKNIDISISPNPASENINIYIPVEYENSISNIELFDINGNLLDNINSYNYNAANLPNGTYYICFTINNCKYYRAFIIAN